MSQNTQASGQQSRESRGVSSSSDREPSKSKSEEWTGVEDPSERRRIQNKLAQRRFRKYHRSFIVVVDDTNVSQGIKSANRKRRPNGKWRTNDVPRAPTLVLNPVRSIRELSFPVSLGAVHLCDTSSGKAGAKTRVHNEVLVKTPCMRPPQGQGAAVGEPTQV
jgi:hypothetical protein